ncbi:unnamed protein product [Psylliodes chrysocephalus]|uniref:Peptidase S1 domain-containing protein n=1 Tax=Psylliodes chrysocephalus TaxID=3402493 RepID=A0A9P0CTW0_9CUCU|nr:unnamed protein product [Psylliodes chrysocephala]
MLSNIVFVFCLITVGYSEDSSGTKCIPLKDCPYAMNMVHTEKYASTTIEFLKKSDCGYSTTDGPLVQCPAETPLTPNQQSDSFDCTTSTGKKGKCKDVNDCNTIRNIFVTIKDFEVCKQSNDKEDIEMKICCFKPEHRGFDVQPPKGYSPQLIPIEESTLQEFIEPASVEIVSNDLNQHDTSTDHPNIQSTSTASHEMRLQDTQTVYQNFINDLNQKVGESDNLNFAIIDEAKKSTPVNSISAKTPKGDVNFENGSNNLNKLVPQKPVTRQSKGSFSNFSDKINQKRSENKKPVRDSPTMVFPEDSLEEKMKPKPEILKSSVVKKKSRPNKHTTTRILHSVIQPFFTNLKISKRVKRELKNELVMSVRLVKKPQSAKLRPLTHTPENSENSQEAVSRNRGKEDSIVRRKMIDKSRNLEAHKIVPQHAKLRPSTLTEEHLEAETDRLSSNGSYGHPLTRVRISDKFRKLKPRKIVPQYAKLRPLTLVKENAKLVKDTENLNGSNRYSIADKFKDLWIHKIVPQLAKLKPLTLTPENSEVREVVKGIVRPNGSIEHLIAGRASTDTATNLGGHKIVSQHAKLRYLTLTSDNSEIIKHAISANGSNEYSTVHEEKPDTAINLESYKNDQQQGKLRPLTLTAENSEIVKDTVSSNGSNTNSIVSRESSNEAIHVDPQSSVPQQGKLRPLTLTANTSENNKDTVSSNENNEYSIVHRENLDGAINLELRKSDHLQDKLRPLTLTAENSGIVKGIVSPNERIENTTDLNKSLDAAIYLDLNDSVSKQAKLRTLSLTPKNSEIVGSNRNHKQFIDIDKKVGKAMSLLPHKSVPQSAKLRPLSPENSDIVKDAVGSNRNNEHSIDIVEKSGAAMNLVPHKSDLQQAKLRPLSLTSKNSDIIKDSIIQNGSNKHATVLREISDAVMNLELHKIDPQQAKLRSLTLTPKNADRIKDSLSPNGSNEDVTVLREKHDAVMNLELQKIDPQQVKLRPLILTPKNSDIIKDTISSNGSNEDATVLREKHDAVINLELQKIDPQQVKLRPLTLTPKNSNIIKDTVSPNGSNEHLIVFREKSDTAKNVQAHKIDPEYAKLRPLTLSPENSEITDSKMTKMSRHRRAIRNDKGKYSRNLDFDYYDKNNFHKRYFYPKHENKEIVRPPHSYWSEEPSRDFYKPPSHRRPYFPSRNFYDGDDVEMINESDFPPTNRPRFSGSPRDDIFGCGRTGRRDRNRIIGGIPVALGEYPWMALLQYSTNKGIKNGCGGSLINSRYILTAAHCVDDEFLKLKKIKLFRVILGEFDISRDPDCISSPESTVCAEPSRVYGISNTIKHQNFDRFNAINDIALIQLDRDVIFSDYIKPICLPPSNFNHNNESVIIAGWGRTKVGGTYSEVLNKAILPIVDQEFCNRLGLTLTSGQICLGLGDGLDTCNGDSGGAIMVQKMENVELVTYQYGIISYGFASKECGKAPSVNTFVPNYLKWIYSILSSTD